MKPVKVMLIIVGMLISSTSLCFAVPNPSGYYRMSSFGDETQGNNPWSEFARIYLDGSGNGYYYSGSDPSDNGPFTYTIAADGQLTIDTGEDVIHGIVSADGSIFTFAETNADEPGIDVGIKESTVAPNPSGYYRMSGFGDETQDNHPWSGLTRIYLDGNGHGTYQDLYTSDNDPESGSFTYFIASDGQLTIDVVDPETQLHFQLHGMVSADGSIFTIAETGVDEFGIDVGIKESNEMSNGSANGCYLMSQCDDQSSHNAPWSALTRICLDGNGNGTYQDLYTSDNDPLESGSFTYSIAADGQLTIYTEGMQFHGVVGADGNVFTVAITVGLEPGILVGIKQSAVNALPGIPLLLLKDN